MAACEKVPGPSCVPALPSIAASRFVSRIRKGHPKGTIALTSLHLPSCYYKDVQAYEGESVWEALVAPVVAEEEDFVFLGAAPQNGWYFKLHIFAFKPCRLHRVKPA